MSNDKTITDKKNFIKLMKTIHLNMQKGYSNLETAKQNRMTEVHLDSTINAYCEVNIGSNNIAASADKQRNHLVEQHPNVRLENPLNPPLDLHMTGGKRDLSLESEVGGTKAVKHDLKKLEERPINEDKVMITEAKSYKSINGKITDLIKKTSQNTKHLGHLIVYRQKNKKANTAKIYIKIYIDGKCFYSDI